MVPLRPLTRKSVTTRYTTSHIIGAWHVDSATAADSDETESRTGEDEDGASMPSTQCHDDGVSGPSIPRRDDGAMKGLITLLARIEEEDPPDQLGTVVRSLNSFSCEVYTLSRRNWW